MTPSSPPPYFFSGGNTDCSHYCISIKYFVRTYVVWSHVHQCTFSPNDTSINGFQSSSGVINFVPADGPTFGDVVTSSKHLAGISFTGSVRTFTHLTKQVGENISAYNNYPKIVGGMLVCVNVLYCVEHCMYCMCCVYCIYCMYCVYCTP